MSFSRSRNALCLGAALATLAGCGAGSHAGAQGATDAREHYDLLITDVSVVDGTGAPALDADVLIKGDTIVSVGTVERDRISVDRVIAGRGRMLTPGFIDTHAHGNPLTQSFESYLAMGVTTVVLGQDGSSIRLGKDAAPGGFAQWADAADASGIDINAAALSGHGSIRHLARIPDSVRQPSAEQEQRMVAVLKADLEAGTFGLSTGLEYVPGIYSQPHELIPLARIVGAYGGVIMSHMRSEDDDKINQSIEELIAQGAYARVHISHLKVIFGKGEERAHQLLDFIRSKRAAGFDLTADAYPYTAGYTGVGILFPKWALPPTDYTTVLAKRRAELAEHLERRMTSRGGPGALLFASEPYVGKTLAQAAQEAGKSYVDLLIDMGPTGGEGAHFTMDEALQDALVESPLVAISTDGAPGVRHPRSTGTYARLLEHYVRETHALSVEEAVRKASGWPARIMGFTDRGVIRPGAKADLVLFDFARVHATSTYVEPFRLAEGFDVVILNGHVVRENGVMLPGRYGRVLRASHRGGSKE